MAHFAQLDENNIVLQVVVVDNEHCLDENNVENEQVGIEYCLQFLDGRWIQTSYNGNIRKNYAGVGFSYDPEIDAFLPPRPFPSWQLDLSTYNWVSPSPCPEDNPIKYRWDEESLAWESIL